MAGGKVPLVRSFLLGPPHFAEDVRHAAEVLGGCSVPGPGVKKTEDVVLPVGQHIHGNENVRKVEGRVTDIQRLDETDPHVQLVTETLPAVGGAVTAAARYLGRAAGKAAIDFSPFTGFGYDLNSNATLSTPRVINVESPNAIQKTGIVSFDELM